LGISVDPAASQQGNLTLPMIRPPSRGRASYVNRQRLGETWLIGGLRSGPRDLGCAQAATSPTCVLRPVATGVGAFGAFFGPALVARRIPLLNDATTGLMQHAHQGSDRLVLASTVANAVGEEVFFRRTRYARSTRRLPAVHPPRHSSS
jgi:hypothetical protein